MMRGPSHDETGRKPPTTKSMSGSGDQPTISPCMELAVSSVAIHIRVKGRSMDEIEQIKAKDRVYAVGKFDGHLQ